MSDDGWQEELRARGYRLTPQRELVLEAIAELGHATPEDVTAAVRRIAASVNVSTVYRTLELLESLGLVTHAHLGHGPATYHLAAAAAHAHLVCRGCAAVTEAEPAALEALVRILDAEAGFLPDLGHLAVFGTCAACRARSPE